jgi:hypothetical protein
MLACVFVRMERWSKMVSLRTEMKKLRIILALACSFTASTHAVAQAKAGRVEEWRHSP